jgi:hypothetical protein
MAHSDTPAVRTYGNWRRPASAGLFGLGSAGTALMMGGLVLVVLVTMTAGLLRGLLLFTLLTGALGAVAAKDKHGRSLAERAQTRLLWATARRRGATLYRSGPLGFTAWGTHQLPGIAASLRLTEHTDAYGRAFALIHAPATTTYTVPLAASPDGASLVDRDQVDVWVADWGHWLANLADEPGLAACTVTIETAPDSGHDLRTAVHAHIDPHAPEFAATMLREVVAAYPAGSSVTRAWVALTFSALSPATGDTRDPDAMGRDLGTRLPGLIDTLRATGAGAVRPVSAQELCELVRVAYDPAVAPLVDQAHHEQPGLSWADVGPAAAIAEWDGYRHDSGYSVTWAMSTAPRGNVQSGVLERLLAPHPDIDRKRVTIVYRPVDAARAAAIVEADLRAAEFVASASKKPTARSVTAARAAAATAAEEAAGAGLVNFALLVTATVTDPDRAPQARAAIDTLAATARLRLRPVYGGQPAAFAAALPIGLILPQHLSRAEALHGRL